MRKTLPVVALLVALALLAGGLALLLREGDSDAGLAAVPDGASGEVAAAPDEPTAELRPVEIPDQLEGLRGIETSVAWPVEIELLLLRAAGGPSAPGVAPMGSGRTARLRGRVVGAGGVGVPTTLTFVAGLNQGRVLAGNAEGYFGAADLYPGAGLVRVEGATIAGALREVRLVRGKETLLNLGFGLAGAVGGMVFGPGEEPLEGVQVELDGLRAATNAAGQFVYPAVASGTDVVLLLRKQGFATQRHRIGVAAGRTIPPEHYRYKLERGCSLEVSIPTSVGAGGPASVVLVPMVGPAGGPTSQKYAWETYGPYELTPGGNLRIDDLPPTRVGVRVYRRGARARTAQKVAVLRPGHVERVQIELEPAPVVSGRVVDARGLAVEGAEVVLEAPDRVAVAAQHLAQMPQVFEAQPLPALPPAVQRTHTDRDGNFALTAWEQLAPRRYLVATSPDGRLRAARVIGPDEHEFELRLEPVAGGSARLLLEFPGRRQGLPVEVAVNGELQPEVLLAPSELLPLDGLAAGLWRVTARWNGRELFAGTGTRELDLKGEERLEVPLPPGAIEGQDEDTLLRSGRR